MPLGTIDRSPPPFFRQGASALTRLIFFAALAVVLMVGDARYGWVQPLRAVVATALFPLQRAAQSPTQAWDSLSDYAQGLSQAVQSQRQAHSQLLAQSQQVSQLAVLKQENERLRALLSLQPVLGVPSRAAQVLYEAADPYSRKVFIDLGAHSGVVAGSPVVNEAGVLGQVTRVYPLMAEVTLVVDRHFTIPVLNARTRARSAAWGGAAHPGMELRFVATNADVQVGDELMTSGIDAVYPAGLKVAQVVSVERQVESGFARILLKPAALPDGVRQVLVLDPVGAKLPPPPAAAGGAASAPSAKASRSARAAAPSASAAQVLR